MSSLMPLGTRAAIQKELSVSLLTRPSPMMGWLSAGSALTLCWSCWR